MAAATRLNGVLESQRATLLDAWLAAIRTQSQGRNALPEREVQQQATEFIDLLGQGLKSGNSDLGGPEWQPLRGLLDEVSRSRALQGHDASQTATFIFSFKQPLFDALRRALANEPEVLAQEVWNTTQLIDSLGLHTVRAFQRSREDIINRQQQDLLELSTPVVKLWDGVLALPMIGTLDSARTQIVMESLLQRIVETGSQIAIIDITGVPTVDTLVAQHLLKTVTAIRLMGADCIVSGVRPQIAQTIVHLGVDLQGVITKANLADALALALKRSGFTVTKTA